MPTSSSIAIRRVPRDIYRLIRLAQEKVYQQWSVLLEPEVRILGSFED
jgi:UDP-N-acetylmuramate dehydrogenase